MNHEKCDFCGIISTRLFEKEEGKKNIVLELSSLSSEEYISISTFKLMAFWFFLFCLFTSWNFLFRGVKN